MNATFELEAELRRLPDQPGVYRMYNSAGILIYVGKARVLKNRVRQYFQKNGQHTPKVQAMVNQIARFDYIVTDSEIEALILESNLIKKHLPKYNILERDDKKYPWIGVSADAYPRIFITRDPNIVYRRKGRQSAATTEDNGKGKRKPMFFGPYTSSRDMYHVLDVIKKHFPLRQRPKPLFRDRPCMNYFIGTCPGPCQKLITPEAYDETLKLVALFLKGRSEDLLDTLEQQMEQASETLNFELAARIRDRVQAVENLIATQKVFYQDTSINYDIIAACGDSLRCAFNVFSIRRGKLIASRAHEVLLTNHDVIEEVYSTFVYDYYNNAETEDLPDNVILQYPVEDEDLLIAWLNKRRHEFRQAQTQKAKANLSQRAITSSHPEKGDKRDLLEMSFNNAKEALEKAKIYDASRLKNDPMRALMSLQDILDLPVLPLRMECYDISHMQGGQTVASMVVFTNGVPDKSQYRRFKIKTAEGKPDDFKSMNEVISRRAKYIGKSKPTIGKKNNDKDIETNTDAERDGISEAASKWPDPDLIIIDGGKGQLGAALDALMDAGVTGQPMISLAKKFEEVFLPGQSRPVLIDRDAPALFLLQQIRDEAHRFAITYHRELRGKAATVSKLDGIHGVGSKTKQLLHKHFDSVKSLERASLEELKQIPSLPKKLAETIYNALHEDSPEPSVDTESVSP